MSFTPMPTKKSVKKQLTVDGLIKEVSKISGEHPVVFDFGGKPGYFLICRKTNQLQLGMLGEGNVHGTQRPPTKNSLLLSAKEAVYDIFPGIGEIFQADPQTPLWAQGRAIVGVKFNKEYPGEGACVIVTRPCQIKTS